MARSPYIAWAKSRPTPRFDLATSHVRACTLDDLPGASAALALSGSNADGYPPLLEAIAGRYGVSASSVTVAAGASGANFLVLAALLQSGDEVLVERPGYDPLREAPRLVSAVTTRFDRVFAHGYRLDPDRVRAALTPRTRLIVCTSPHNPSGMLCDEDALREVGRLAESVGAFVLVDEVNLDACDHRRTLAARLGERFISTSSLAKSYGLASLRCGWIISSPGLAERLRRTRDLVDGAGSIVAERLAALAFSQLDRLAARAAGILTANHAIARELLAVRSDLEWIDPRGGTILFPRLRDLDDSSRFCDSLLHDHDTAVVPGRFFEAPAHFRLGLGGEPLALRGGLAAIAAALDAG